VRLLARRHGLDLLIVLLALEAALEVAFRHDPVQEPRTTVWVAAPAAALVVLPLLARRRFAFGAPAAVWVLSAALSFADGRLVVFPAGILVAGMVASFLLGNLPDDRQARLGLAIVVGAATILAANDPTGETGDFLVLPILFSIAWVGGFALRERAAQAEAAEERAAAAEREREAAARVAVAEERARIARELHDIVAHSVSVMVLSTGAVRHRLPPALGEETEALQAVEQTGRNALAEMRRLLGAMRDDGAEAERAPQPGLNGLDALVADVRRAGLPVDLRVEGDRSTLPQALDLSAYRIVQEGLTNALKHASASRADVLVRLGPDDLEIEVRDDGVGTGGRNGAAGHGLVGVRERVKIYGGDMSATAGAAGGFTLRTRLPLRAGTR
jgi:signal transduction histidine kinase